MLRRDPEAAGIRAVPSSLFREGEAPAEPTSVARPEPRPPGNGNTHLGIALITTPINGATSQTPVLVGLARSQFLSAEEVGFEPTVPRCGTPVFETGILYA